MPICIIHKAHAPNRDWYTMGLISIMVYCDSRACRDARVATMRLWCAQVSNSHDIVWSIGIYSDCSAIPITDTVRSMLAFGNYIKALSLGYAESQLELQLLRELFYQLIVRFWTTFLRWPYLMNICSCNEIKLIINVHNTFDLVGNLMTLI